jgi:hypothetical protein
LLGGKIILIQSKEANYQFELTKKLVENNNYLVFINLVEGDSFEYVSLKDDLPDIKRFPQVVGGIRPDLFHVNTDSFFFLTLTDTAYLRATEYTTPGIYQKTHKPYSFLYLNGRNSHWRNKLWHSVNQKNLLDRALWSYIGYPPNNPTFDPCDIPLTVLPKQYESNYVDTQKAANVDADDRNVLNFRSHYWGVTHWVSGHVEPQQYIDTYFSLVSESSSDYVFITEKTYKPIIAGHPFIILSGTGAYKHLHDLGFKTFEPWIDESFDQEPDLDRRVEMIAQQVKQLCAGDLNKFLHEVQDICLYNQQHYATSRHEMFVKVHHRLKDFFKVVIDDAQTYFKEKEST